MLKPLKRFWRWLKNLFQGGSAAPKQRRKKTLESAPPLTDTDYEFLLNQLLEGISHGWHEGRIIKFFQKLGDRGKARLWVDWLERFGRGVLASEAPNLELAARLIRFGELSQSFSPVQPIGQAAYQLGREIYAKQSANAVWEYEGTDAELPVLPVAEDSNGSEAAVPMLTPEQLLAQLYLDTNLAAQLAEQLHIEESDPEALVEELVRQLQAAHQELESQSEPQTAEDWFNRGMQQANLGDVAGAITSWDWALELNPNLAEAWHNRGSALGNLGQNEAAIASFERALAINPNDAQFWLGKGNAHYNLEQWEAAITCWDKSLELQPDLAETWYNRGSALEKLHRIDEAINSYQKALAIAPDFDLVKVKLQELSSGDSGVR